MRYTGLLLLSIWLILHGIGMLFRFHFPYDQWLVPGFALLSGIVLLLNSLRRLLGNLGLGLLGVWLILSSLFTLYKHVYTLPYNETTLAILGLITAFLLIIKR